MGIGIVSMASPFLAFLPMRSCDIQRRVNMNQLIRILINSKNI